jgi:hypothetical protein
MSKIDELKKEYPKGVLIEFEDGAWVFFKTPTRQQLGMAMNQARTNPMSMVEVLVRNCAVATSEGLDLQTDEAVGYLMGIAEQVDAIIGVKKASIKN